MSLTKQIVFREPVDRDLTKIWNLLQDVSDFFPSEADNLLARVMGQESAFLQVAESQKQLIGFGSLFVYQRIRGGKVGVVEDLVVGGKYRKLGVGKALLGRLAAKAWDLDCHKVSLQASPDSEGFYEAVGFEISGRSLQKRKPADAGNEYQPK